MNCLHFTLITAAYLTRLRPTLYRDNVMNSRYFSLCAHPIVILLLALAASPAPAAPTQTIILNASTPGPLFEGVGAVSGGGATSVLLKDYPEAQRSQILDILFKPNFAASMQALYVEIGGDGNSTQGTEPTHMRTRTDENYSRGYEWWLMVEAKKRNPDLTLDGTAWGCPGWIGTSLDNIHSNFWSQDMADYYVKWVKGLKDNYGLELSAIGCRNERGAVTDWLKTFRKTLDAAGLNSLRIHAFDNPGNKYMWDWIPELAKDKQLADSVAILGNHCLNDAPFPPADRDIATRLNKPIWNTEEHVYNEGSRVYKDEFECAIGAIHLFNNNFISRGATKIVNWYLVGSTYNVEPYADQPPALFARSPWSGHYSLKPIVWSYAHYGQFTKVGWHYIPSACTALSGGGTVVALKSDDGNFSVIAETAGAGSPQSLSFKLAGLSAKSLCLWRTTRAEQFIRQPDITPAADGTFTFTADPDSIYSLSTTTGQQKGTFADVPAEKPFPFPYLENFDHYPSPKSWGYLPHYTADICGVFEIADRPDHKGQCLRQVVGRKAESWAPEWMPYTTIGDDRWTDYEVSADLFFDNGGWAGVMGRITNTGNGWDGNPSGYYARLYPDGGVALYVAGNKYRGPREKQLAVGEVKNWKWNQWHNLKLRFEKQTLTVLVDGTPILTTQDTEYDHGQAGLITGGEGTARNTALFDNLLINRPGGGEVPPTPFPQDSSPIYKP